MAGNRGDGNTFGSRRGKPLCKPAVDGCLRSGIIRSQIFQQRWCIGMRNGQFERCIFPGKRSNQPP
jgi:hypothetical protein